jgi:hypothetical protein
MLCEKITQIEDVSFSDMVNAKKAGETWRTKKTIKDELKSDDAGTSGSRAAENGNLYLQINFNQKKIFLCLVPLLFFWVRKWTPCGSRCSSSMCLFS